MRLSRSAGLLQLGRGSCAGICELLQRSLIAGLAGVLGALLQAERLVLGLGRQVLRSAHGLLRCAPAHQQDGKGLPASSLMQTSSRYKAHISLSACAPCKPKNNERFWERCKCLKENLSQPEIAEMHCRLPCSLPRHSYNCMSHGGLQCTQKKHTKVS